MAGATSSKPASLASKWYEGNNSTQSAEDIANEAFIKATKLFDEKFSDGKNKKWQSKAHSMEDVLKTVNAGKRKYDMRTKHMDARRWLRKLSRGILYYASILDVIAQHHPEYVSLAWGAMKFTLVGIINHEHLVVELSKALCTVADVLPNAELKNLLYPTEQMKHAVAVLYTQILELLERAAQWYKAGKIRHFIGSITKPWVLQFSDIVEEISIAARRVDQLAISASMAEQRDMNLQQQEMRLEQKLTYEAVLEVKRITKEYQKLNMAGALDTNRRVCEIQFSQIMTFMEVTSMPTPHDARTRLQATRKIRRRVKRLTTLRQPIWSSPALQDWADAKESAVINICGSYATKTPARDFAIDAIDFIEESQVPMIWALNVDGQQDATVSLTEVLKHLILQVLRINHTMLTEKSLALNAAQFQSATTLADWIKIFAAVLRGIPHAYIVIDAEVTRDQYEAQWPQVFELLFDELKKQRIESVVKCAVVWYIQQPYEPGTRSIKLYSAAPSAKRMPTGRSRGGPQHRKLNLRPQTKARR